MIKKLGESHDREWPTRKSERTDLCTRCTHAIIIISLFYCFNLKLLIFFHFSGIIINWAHSLLFFRFSVHWSLMALAHYLVAVPVQTSKRAKTSVLTSSSSSNEPMFSLALTSSSLLSKARNLSIFPRIHRIIHKGNFFYYCFDLAFITVLGLVFLSLWNLNLHGKQSFCLEKICWM